MAGVTGDSPCGGGDRQAEGARLCGVVGAMVKGCVRGTCEVSFMSLEVKVVSAELL